MVQYWHEESHRSGWTRGSYILCGDASLALFNMICGFRGKYRVILITLGVGATDYKVRTKWPHIHEVYDGVRCNI